MKTKENSGKKLLIIGIMLLMAFAVWTYLIQTIDVQPVGQNGTVVGFAELNCKFHTLTGVHMKLYTITDWLGLVPVFVCIIFGVIGLIQLIKRKSIFKVDKDIIFLGIYYIIVIVCYIIFEMFPINYRPILIEEVLEASYPSSTTILVLSVMPTLVYQADKRLKIVAFKKYVCIFSILFSLFMVIGRTLSGVHWLTDIIGAVLLSFGLYFLYKASVLLWHKKEI